MIDKTRGPVEALISESLAQQLEGYKGQWVAVDQATSRVVASGQSAKEVSDRAIKESYTDPLILFVPTHPERLNLL